MLTLRLLSRCLVVLAFYSLADASKREGTEDANKRMLIGTHEPSSSSAHPRIFNPHYQGENRLPRGRGITAIEERRSVDPLVAESVRRLDTPFDGDDHSSKISRNPVFPIDEPSIIVSTGSPIHGSPSMSVLVSPKSHTSTSLHDESDSSPPSKASGSPQKDRFTFRQKKVTGKQSTSSQSCCSNCCVLL